jgi:hypothetical protein
MELLEDVVVLWTTEWWDGPVRGVATGGNRHYWFDAVFDQATDEFVDPRRLVVYELTEEEYAQEAERHKRWEEAGGTSYCFHLPVEQRAYPSMNNADALRFDEEERVRPRPDYTSREPSGWFVPGSLRRF